MRRPKALFLALMFLVSVTAVAFASNHNSQGQTKSVFPPGNWNFSAHPFMGEGYKTRPVMVTSVRSEAATLTVDAVSVRNNSAKRVMAIKFGWVLSYDDERDKILRRGETPLLPMSNVLNVGEGRFLKSAIVSFADLQKSLVKKGRLDGNYRLEVLVTELLFDDRSTWRVDKMSKFAE